ncbi:MAG: right-handed parallel beta-helix repeat-containing protein [Chitinophagaceae bacterium]|nr:right-handed parallel beta-helix repeat-containing protein [Chitinophagaceae bacterium]
MRSLYILFLFTALSASGNTYYFSSSTGDDSRTAAQAQHAATPWKTLYKLNAYFSNLRPGDSVLLQRGSVFIGPLKIIQSGAAGQPIVLSTYGAGDMPVVSGLSKLTGWTSQGKGIWTAPCPDCGVAVNVLTIAGKTMPMGRTPNADEPNGGYLTIQSHVKNQSITDNSLANGPDWTGAEAVIRKNHYILDRNRIISQSGNTLNYRSGSYAEPTDQFGYFIQNDIRTLDKKGEWYYDPKTRTMNLYFEGDDPSGTTIMAGSVDNLVVIKDQSHLVFKGIAFGGSNFDIFDLTNASDIHITDCNISFAGRNAIKAVKAADIAVERSEIRSTNSDAIKMEGTGSLIQDNKISLTGAIPGLGSSDTSYTGIYVAGSNHIIRYNQIDSTGYSPIFFNGDGNTIQNNAIRSFAFVKDDGGGIYTWSGNADTLAQRDTSSIIGNIVLDGITAPDGTDRKHASIAYGIYLDHNSARINVSGNTVSRCTGGIFLQDAHEVTVRGNTLYDNGFQLSLRRVLVKGTVRNNRIMDNTAVARSDNETVLELSSAITGDISSYADFDDNKYAQRANGKTPFFRVTTRPGGGNQVQVKGDLGQWKTGFGKDKSSVVALPGDQVLFEYNSTKANRSVTLNGTYADLSGRTYQGKVDLPPFTSVLLLKK